MPKGIPNKRYTPEFKQMVVETMREEHLSVRELPSKVEEDLLAEVQRLRAENEYLKNLQALVLEEERRQRRKRRQSRN